MQTNREYFNTLTVPVLKSILSDFGATGISKMRKGELINFLLPLMDGAHLDAIAEDAARKPAEVVSTPRTVKSYNERMDSRIAGYSAQRNGGKLTAKQYNRIGKKVNRHHAKLVKALHLIKEVYAA